MTPAPTPSGVAADPADHVSAPWSAAGSSAEPLQLVIANEAGEAARAWIRLARSRYQNGLRGLVTLVRCRTPQDLIAARAELLCEDLDLIRAGCEGISEIVAGAAGSAVRVIDARTGN